MNSATCFKELARFSASYSGVRRKVLNGPVSRRRVSIPSFLAPQKSVCGLSPTARALSGYTPSFFKTRR